MRTDAKGAVLFEGEQHVSTEKLNNLTAAIGTGDASGTATLVPFFGPTIGGESTVTDPHGLAMDLSRALLAGLTYEWNRPFARGERVHVRVVVDDVHTKGSNVFGVVAAEFTDADGNLVHRQTATFIERGGAA
jgi:hypothetical protein